MRDQWLPVEDQDLRVDYNHHVSVFVVVVVVVAVAAAAGTNYCDGNFENNSTLHQVAGVMILVFSRP